MKKTLLKIIVLILLSLFSLNYTFSYYNSSSSLKSQFKTINYYFKLNSSGGIFEKKQVVVANNTAFLPEPTRLGYKFLGYSLSSGGEVNYSAEINNVKEINNKELYAKWNMVYYNISYNLNGGSISNQPTSYNVEDGFKLPKPVKEGYSFAGWSGTGLDYLEKNVIVINEIGDRYYTANWTANKYSLDINSVIQNTTYSSGLSGFTYSVWINDTLVANNVVDYNTTVEYGSKVRVLVNERDGYNITSFKDQTWTITSDLIINPTWYDNIAPTITSFTVENLGYYNPAKPSQGYNLRVTINAYDNGTGVQKYQTWIKPYSTATGSARKDGQTNLYTNIVYMNVGRTLCGYAIDNAGNEAEKCETIKV